jgi:hypothetical protein
MPISPIPDRGFWGEHAPAPSSEPADVDPAPANAAPSSPAPTAGFAANPPGGQPFDQEGPDHLTSPAPPLEQWRVRDASSPLGRAQAFDDTDHSWGDPRVATEYTSPGMPARGVIVLSAGSAVGCAALDLALTGGLTIFFDLCFIVVCLVGAMGVRRRDLFTAGVLAPLVLAGVVAVVTAIAPDTFAITGGVSKAFLSGLAQHAGALVAGYGLALATIAGRVTASRPAPAL